MTTKPIPATLHAKPTLLDGTRRTIWKTTTHHQHDTRQLLRTPQGAQFHAHAIICCADSRRQHPITYWKQDPPDQ